MGGRLFKVLTPVFLLTDFMLTKSHDIVLIFNFFIGEFQNFKLKISLFSNVGNRRENKLCTEIFFNNKTQIVS